LSQFLKKKLWNMIVKLTLFIQCFCYCIMYCTLTTVDNKFRKSCRYQFWAAQILQNMAWTSSQWLHLYWTLSHIHHPP
jgi:hypothetical protein